MKRMIKRALAMVLALMLAVPAFTLAEESEGFVPPVEEWEEVEISLGDDAASDDSGETGAPIEEEAPPEVYAVLVRAVVTPEDAAVTVYEADDAEQRPLEPLEDGTWLLMPGAYAYTAVAEGYIAVEREPFEVVEQKEDFELKIELEPEAEGPSDPADDAPTDAPADQEDSADAPTDVPAAQEEDGADVPDGAEDADDDAPAAPADAEADDAPDPEIEAIVEEEALDEDDAIEDSGLEIIDEETDQIPESEQEQTMVSFEQTLVVNGVAVTVTAEAGAFPAGSKLCVTQVPVARQREADAAVEEARDEAQNVAVSYTFDIKVLDEFGQEIEPAEGYQVCVSFALAQVADENLEANVYHITEDVSGDLTADKLTEVEVDAAQETLTAETDGFSLYTVEFTYNALEYVLEGDGSVPVNEIASAVGLVGSVESASVSNPALFSVSEAAGEWILTAHRPFASEEWLRVVIGGIEYEIAVKDDISYYENGQLCSTAAYSQVTSETNEMTEGFYAVSGSVTLNDRLSVSGDVELILCDGATLTAPYGMRLTRGNSLTVYGQQSGANNNWGTGWLIAIATEIGYAGIGGDDQESGGDFTLYGGHVQTTGYDGGAGLGGGDGGCGGVVTVRGGELKATGGDSGAGVGGGIGGSQGGAVTVWNGVVEAAGGDYAAGIGGGENASDQFGNDEFGGNGGYVSVWGGQVTARGGCCAAGIGGGLFGDGGTLRVGGSAEITASAGTRSSDDQIGLQAIGRGEYSTQREGEKQREGSVVLPDTAKVTSGDSAATATECSYYKREKGCRMPYAHILNAGQTKYAITAEINQVKEDRVTDIIDVRDESGKSIVEQAVGQPFKVVVTLVDSELESLEVSYTSGGVYKQLEDNNPVESGNVRTYTFTMPDSVDDGVHVKATVKAQTFRVTLVDAAAGIADSGVFVNSDVPDSVTYAAAGERVWVRSAANDSHPDYWLQKLVVRGDVTHKVYASLENDTMYNIAMGSDESLWWFYMPDAKEDVTVTVEYAEGCHYIVLNGTRKVRRYFTEIKTQESLTLDGNGLSAGWYIVRGGNVHITNRLNITADVNIILCDGATLYADDGIFVCKRLGGKLTIWAQNKGSGTLYADATGTHWAGIGGNERDNGGPITINGGTIYAYGGTDAAGIGGGDNSETDEITINLPKGKPTQFTYVNPWGGKYGAGIGGGQNRNNRKTVINGGEVYAYGGRCGAGIGGGEGGGSESIEINGGIVMAYAGYNAAGLGGGEVEYGGGFGGKIVINGGEVYAEGKDGGAGIGGGGDGGEGAEFIVNGCTKVEVKSGDGCASAVGGGHDCGSAKEGTRKLADHLCVHSGSTYANKNNRESFCNYQNNVIIEPCNHEGATPVMVDYTYHKLVSCERCKMGGKLEKHTWGTLDHNQNIKDGECTICHCVRYYEIQIHYAEHIDAQLFAGDTPLNMRSYSGGNAFYSGIYLDQHSTQIKVKIKPQDGYRLTGENLAFYLDDSGERQPITLSGPTEEEGWQVYAFTMPDRRAANLTFGAEPIESHVYVSANISGGRVRFKDEDGRYISDLDTEPNHYVFSGKQTITATVYVKSGYVLESFQVFRRGAGGADGAAYAFENPSLYTYRFNVGDGDLNVRLTFKDGKRGRIYHVLQQIGDDGEACWPDASSLAPLSRTVVGTYGIPNNPSYEVLPKGSTSWNYEIKGYLTDTYSQTAENLNPAHYRPISRDNPNNISDATVVFQRDGEKLYVYYALEKEPLTLNKANGGTAVLQVPFGAPVKKYLEIHNETPQKYGYGTDYVWAWRNEKGKLVRLTDSLTMPDGGLTLEADNQIAKAPVWLDLGRYDPELKMDDPLWPYNFQPEYNQNEDPVTMDPSQPRAFEITLGDPLSAATLRAMHGTHTKGYRLEGWYTGDELWEDDRGITEDDLVPRMINGSRQWVLILHARWKERDAIIEYDPANSAWSKEPAPEPTLVDIGQSVYLPSAESKPGWYFANWVDEVNNKSYSNLVSFTYNDMKQATELVDTADPDARNIIRLKAAYSPHKNKPHDIYFYAPGEEKYRSFRFSVSGDQTDQPYTLVVSGDTTQVLDQNGNVIFSLDNPAQEGYTFVGWSFEDDPVAHKRLSLPFVWQSKRTVSHYLYARWELKKYALTLDLDGGWWMPGTALKSAYYMGEKLPNDTYTWEDTEPRRDHYDFAGWQIEGESGNQLPDTMPAHDVSAKALWEPHPYKMRFWSAKEVEETDENGNPVIGKDGKPVIVTNVDLVKTIEAAKDTVIGDQLPDNPTREGYEFVEWYPGNPPTVMPGYDSEYIARWLELQPKPNAPVIDSATRNTLTVKAVAGQEYKLLLNGNIEQDWTAPAEGAETVTFTGLTPGTTYQVVTYIPGDGYSIKDSPVSEPTDGTTLDEVRVTLDVNADDAVMAWSGEIVLDMGQTLPADAWSAMSDAVRPGYNRTGWYSTQDHETAWTGDREIAENDCVKQEGNNYYTLTLKASWALRDAVVVFDLNGGAWPGDAPDAITVTAEDGKFTLPEAEPVSHADGKVWDFTGWKDAASETHAAKSKLTYTEAIVTEKGVAEGEKNTITLTATYAEKAAKNVTLVFETNGGTIYSKDNKITNNSITVTIPQGAPSANLYIYESGDEASGYYMYTVKCGDTALDHFNIQKAGHTFQDWYTNEACTQPVAGPLVITRDIDTVTVYAKWAVAQFSMVFMLDDSHEYVTITQDYNTNVIPPADPTKEYHTFKKWQELTNNGWEDTEVPTKMPANDLTLRARWEPNTYTLTFNPVGGALPAGTESTITAQYGTAINPPANPTREGCVFLGWKQEGQEGYAELPSTMPGGDRTYVAQWRFAKPDAPTVTAVTRNSLTVQAQSLFKYRIDGETTWAELDPEATETTLTFTDLIPGETYSVVTYRVEDTLAQNACAASPVSDPTTVTLPEAVVVRLDMGAYDADVAAQDKPDYVLPEGEKPNLRGDYWIDALQYEQTDPATDARFGQLGQLRTFIKDAGTTINLGRLSTAERDGYVLDGWYTKSGVKWSDRSGDSQYFDSAEKEIWKPATDEEESFYVLTLSARWTPRDAVIVYDASNGTWEGDAPVSQSIEFGETKTLTNTVPTAPEGKEFVYWQDASGRTYPAVGEFAYKDFDAVTVPGVGKKEGGDDYNENTITLTAVYVNRPAATGALVFDSQGGTAVAPINVTINEGQGNPRAVISEADNGAFTVSVTANDATLEYTYDIPTRTGYDFGGWCGDSQGDTPISDIFDIPYDGKKTVYAKWIIQQHTITFDTMGGSPIDPITQDFDTEITRPADPTKQYYTFKDWSPALPAKMPAADLTVRAVWEPQEHSIKLVYGNGTADKTIAGKYGERIDAIEGVDANWNADPTWEGHKFLGWRLATNTGDTYDALPDTIPGVDQTYTAQWIGTQNKPAAPVVTATTHASLTVQAVEEQVYRIDGGTNWVGATGTTLTFEGLIPGATYQVVTKLPAKDGFLESPVSDPASATLPNEVQVTLVKGANDATITETTTATFDEGQALPADIRSAMSDTTYTGYKLTGWKTQSGATWNADKAVALTDCVKAEGENYYTLTLTAQWALKNANVVYKPSVDGTARWPNGSNGTRTFYNIKPGETVTVIGDEPNKSGYTFSGWQVKGERGLLKFGNAFQYEDLTYAVGTADGNNTITLTAKYQEKPAAQGTLTFDSQGGTVVSDQTVTVYKGEESTSVIVATDLNHHQTTVGTISITGGSESSAFDNPTREGYTFQGWSKTPNGATGNGQSLTFTRENSRQTLYAVWTKNRHNITVRGLGENGTEQKTISGVEYDAPLSAQFIVSKLISSDLTRQHYTFKNAFENLPATMPDKDLTVTALWTAKQYTISFDTQGGTPVEPITADYDAEITEPTPPTKTGYTFAGWNPEFPAKMGEDMTCVAQWTANKHKVTYLVDGGPYKEYNNVEYGAAIPQPANPTKLHYDFIGWTPGLPATMPDNDLVATAAWQPHPYTVTFKDGTVAYSELKAVYGRKIIPPVDPGEDFRGWSEVENGTIVTWPVTVEGDKTYYAVWKGEQSAPEKPTLVADSATQIHVTNTVSTQEYSYRMKGGEWSEWVKPDGGDMTFEGLSPNRTYQVRTRKPETEEYKASDAVESEEVTTPKGTRKAPTPSVLGGVGMLTVLSPDDSLQYQYADADAPEEWSEWQSPQEGELVFENLNDWEHKYLVRARFKPSADDEDYNRSDISDNCEVSTLKPMMEKAEIVGGDAPMVGQLLTVKIDPTRVESDVYYFWLSDNDPVKLEVLSDQVDYWDMFEDQPDSYVVDAAGYTPSADEVGKTIQLLAVQFGEEPSVQFVYTAEVRKRPGAAAQTPKLAGRTANSLTIETRPGEEYSIDGGKTWQTGDTFTGLDPATQYGIVARVAETPEAYAGEPSAPLSATTDKAPGAKAETPKLTGRTSDSLTIETQPGEEYSIDGGKTWQTGDTFTGLDPATEYGIVARKAETATTYAGEPSAPLKAITDKATHGPVEGLTTRSASSATATDGAIQGVKPGMEYSPDGGKTWIPVTGETVEGLAPDKYPVRWAEDASHYAGPATNAEVTAAELDTSAMLIATMRAVGDNALNATWTKVPGADGYDLFFVNCGNYDFKYVGTVAGNAARSYDFANLLPKRGYKVIVKAWVQSGGRQYVAENPVAHCFTSGGGAKSANPASIALRNKAMTVKLGKTARVKATIKCVKRGKVLAHDGRIRCYSSDPTVATVTKKGKIKAVGSGSCLIYVLTSNGVWDTVTVTVDDSPTRVRLAGVKRRMRVGDAQDLGDRVRLTHKKARTTLTWTSSNPDVLSVDANGNVTALSKGTATITVTTHNGKRTRVRIRVRDK